MRKPSVVLLGSKPGSVRACSMLLQRGWDVRGVVATAPERNAWLPRPDLSSFASTNGIRVFDTQAQLLSEPVDFVISYMCRVRVRPPTLALATKAAVNFHPAPLPEYGGWAFYNVAIIENVSEYGCTCHHMDEGFDTGPLIKVRRFPIDSVKETALSLEQRTQREMLHLFAEFCDMAESDKALPSIPQDPSKMRYMQREEFEALKWIPDDADAATIDRYARAFWYPPFLAARVKTMKGSAEIVPRSVVEALAPLVHSRCSADPVLPEP